jgi:hypothetical protein
MGKHFGEVGGWEPPNCHPELVMIQRFLNTGDTSAGPVKKQRTGLLVYFR